MNLIIMSLSYDTIVNFIGVLEPHFISLHQNLMGFDSVSEIPPPLSSPSFWSSSLRIALTSASISSKPHLHVVNLRKSSVPKDSDQACPFAEDIHRASSKSEQEDQRPQMPRHLFLLLHAGIMSKRMGSPDHHICTWTTAVNA